MAVHDEAIIECPAEYVEAAKEWVAQAMKQGMKKILKVVPVVVEVSVSETWGGV